MAVDYGGPGREFFCIILKSIKEKYFDHGLREHLASDYTTIGNIFGLSILQNGSIPRFLEESLLTKTFSESTESVSIMNFRHGPDCLGIYTISMQLPMFLHLLRPTDVKLTLKAVINILKPNFSEEGSNRRQLQNKVYAAFTRYLRSVASGRRGALSLSDILQFTTGANEEPVLGFSIHPSIDFVDVDTLPSFIPTANTCVNGLTLPCPTADTLLPSDNELFALYDYAFVNAFYGLL